MQVATICFLLKGDQICLGLKKRGFGAGKYNGFGGKVGDKEEFVNETIEEAIVREGKEEFDIEVSHLEKCAEMTFLFPEDPNFDGMYVHVYICNDWGDKEPTESEEMKPVWFNLSEIPYDLMWDDDRYWIPRVIEGEKIKAGFEFDSNGMVTKHEINTLDENPKTIERKG